MKKNSFQQKPKFYVMVALAFAALNLSSLQAQDNDNDGVQNTVDLDDDNDGILDTDECGNLLLQSGFENLTGLNNGNNVGENITPWVLGVGNDANVVQVDGAGGFDYPNGNGPQSDAEDNTGAGDLQRYLDIANGSNDFYQTFTLTTNSNVTFGGYFSSRNIGPGNSNPITANGEIQILAGTGTGGAQLATTGTITTTDNTAWLYIESTIILNPGTYSYVVSMDDGMNFDNASVISCPDTDGDTIPDYLDSDSDDDGCPDALEGAGNFSEANINSNGQLVGGVDPVTGVPTATDINNGQGNSLAVLDENDFTACADSDNDGIIDTVDLDDDNDGIPDTEENLSCIQVSDLNTPGFAINIDLTSGNTADLDGFDNGTFDFFASLQGGATWANGVQIQNNPVIGDFIYTQPENTANPGNVAEYVITFPTPVSNFSFITGGLNNDDVVAVSASLGGISIPIGPDNFGNLVQGIEVSGNTVTGTVFDNSFDPLINVFSTFIPGMVDTITITATKGNTFNAPVTKGMYSFGYCIVDEFADFDGDGIINSLDLDSDNDGITDITEAGGTDSDNDGEVDYPTPGDPMSMTDVDMDGLEDGVEATPLGLPNTDALGGPNYLDIDADNDGIPDNIEAQPTSGYIPPSGIGTSMTDLNMNGVDDAYETSIIGITPENTDNGQTNSDALPDYIDNDSDGDGIIDMFENGDTDNTILGFDTDGDGLDDAFDDNDDSAITGATVNDGINPPNGANLGDEDGDAATGGDVDYRDITDFDGDGIPDTVDVDDDNDGVADVDENPTGIDPSADDDNDGVPNYLDDNSSDANIGNDDGRIENGFDIDNDGLPNHFDIDSDNDGITDVVETGNGDLDTDNDGNIDANDTGFADTNNDGQADDSAGTIPVNSDNNPNDGPDFLDIDADDDGIPDNVEAQPTDNYLNPIGDGNNNGLDDAYEGANFIDTPENTDGVDNPDYIDTDSDNDSIDDVIEAGQGTAVGTDSDGDGLDDGFDDSNDTGIEPDVNDNLNAGAVDTDNDDDPTTVEVDFREMQDNDGDGVIDSLDLDNDNDGIPDAVEGIGDADGDGIADYLDLDSDNDGIPDIIEAGGTDADGDGQIDYPTPGDPMSLNDANNNGWDDDIENSPLPDSDSDNDGLVDRLDLDSDNDGIADIIEAGGTDTNVDGQVDYGTPGDPTTMLDIDRDGFIDTIDADDNTVAGTNDGGTALPDIDTDGDGLPNRLDLDSDNDGIYDVVESGGIDADGNGTADDDDDNIDNTASNGIPTSAGGGNIPTDTGADGSPDYVNLDSDGDGCSDANEAYISANADGGDGGQYGIGTPAATGAFGLVTAAAYNTGAVVAVTDGTDTMGCVILDSDGDGVLDDQEIADDTDPNNPCDFIIASITEVQTGDWLLADCDGDGVTNGQEVTDGTNPEDPCDFNTASITLTLSGDYLISDCDGDGVTNETEITDGTDPEDPCDFIEASVTLDRSGDWLTADCDGDMIPNDQENTDGTDPDDPCSNIGGNPPAGANCDTDVAVETDFINPDLNNGAFQINNIESFPNNTVRIYNRWGILVFEIEGYDNANRAFRGISNGRATVNSEKKLPVGVYFYIIEYSDDGTTKTIDGYLYVNR